MVQTKAAEAPAGPAPRALDPFGFLVGAASKVAGLGGNEPSTDHDYAFHTPYVEADEGPAHFVVRFEGLTGKTGTLVLRVHMLLQEPGSAARLATSERILINRLIQNGGWIAVKFEGFHGVSYALYGGILGETDAAADGLTIELDRPADPHRQREVASEARNTSYGRDAAREAAQLLSIGPPTLTNPVGQIATARQLAEPVARDWSARLGLDGAPKRQRWQTLYVFQVLRRYGMLQPGARGLGLGIAQSALPAAIAGFGSEIVVTCEPVEGGDALTQQALLDALRRPALCDEAGFTARVSMQGMSLAELDPDLVNFDFLWSSDTCGKLGGVTAAQQFVESAMACLRPGGLAVHTFEYDPFGGGDPALFQRRHVEQLVLNLIGRRHETAQFKIESQDAVLEPALGPSGMPGTAVGIIVRKAMLAD